MLIILDCAPKSIKKSISRSGCRQYLLFELTKRKEIVKIFSLCGGVLLAYFDVHTYIHTYIQSYMYILFNLA